MPGAGGSNIELAHKLSGGNEKKPHSSRYELEVEILEVIMLDLVAISSVYTVIKRQNGTDSRLRFCAQASWLNVR